MTNRPLREKVKVYRPGRRADEVYNRGDPVIEADSTHRIQTIRRDRDEDVARTRRRSQARINEAEDRYQSAMHSLRPRAGRLRQTDREREARFQKEVADRERDQAKMQRWNELGLRGRLFTLPLSRGWHWVTMVVLAFFDYFIFSQAFAIAEDVNPSPANLRYWLGGIIGVMIFFAGWLWARSLKRMSMTLAQRAIARRVRAEEPNAKIPERGSDHFGVVALFGIVFFTLLYFGLFLRLEAQIESYAVVGLQVLVSVLVVIAEYSFYDPTRVADVKRSRKHRRIRAALCSTEAEIAEEEAQCEALFAEIQADDTLQVHATLVWWEREEEILRTLLASDFKSIDETELAQDPRGRPLQALIIPSHQPAAAAAA